MTRDFLAPVSSLELTELLKRRSIFKNKIRKFFDNRQVLEVETPIFSRSATTDIHLDSFVCLANSSAQPYYLHTSPELSMKKLLASGSGDIYQICQVARGGESGRWHQECFTMLEWYRVGFSLMDLMVEVQDFLKYLFPELSEVKVKSYQQIYSQLLNIDNIHILSHGEVQELVDHHCPEVGRLSHDGCLDVLMTHMIEPKLRSEPCCLVYDYPSSQAALARVAINEFGDRIARRVEVYCWGIECGNGFWELTDPAEQRRRFAEDISLRQEQNLPVYPIDDEYLSALEKGLPACSGIAMGFDRLFALFCGESGLVRM